MEVATDSKKSFRFLTTFGAMNPSKSLLKSMSSPKRYTGLYKKLNTMKHYYQILNRWICDMVYVFLY